MLQRTIRIKLAAFIAMLFCLSMTGNCLAQSNFPYQLSKEDIPPGFRVAGPFSKADKSISISANRGIVTNKELIANIYGKIDVNTISRVYVTSYIPDKHSILRQPVNTPATIRELHLNTQ